MGDRVGLYVSSTWSTKSALSALSADQVLQVVGERGYGGNKPLKLPSRFMSTAHASSLASKFDGLAAIITASDGDEQGPGTTPNSRAALELRTTRFVPWEKAVKPENA
jgi:hypothetical protein